VIEFGDPWLLWLDSQGERQYTIGYQNVSGNSRHWNFSLNSVGRFSVNTSGGFLLPPGYFLICGDRVWGGIPVHPVGGLCYIGKLTLFTPRIRDFLSFNKTCSKRSLRHFDPGCDDNVQLGSVAGTVALSFFLPGGAADRNWNILKKLACWSLKQSNSTSEILTQLLMDVESVRHAVLQNRAATDFLLLVQGHGCQEFEGMCCMNLSDHSQSIHQQLAVLRERTEHIMYNSSLFDSWLSSWGLSGWIRELVKQGIIILVAIIVCLGIVGCASSCMKKLMLKVFNQTWIAQNKEGGFVEDEALKDWGHVSNPAFLYEAMKP